MPRQNVALLAFNRGLVSPKALARTDLDRISFSAETQRNWIPRTLGSMTLRPGWEYIASTASNNKAYYIDFVKSISSTAGIEFTDGKMRVMVDDVIVTRPSVSASITNGGFDSDLAGWTDADESGATSSWETGGYLKLLGTGTNSAIRRQEITVTETGTEHALDIVVERGPVTLKVGSSAGDNDYISATLLTGVHSLALTPTGNFWVEFSSGLLRETLVDSVAIASASEMEIVSPYVTADLQFIRWSQSADVIYLACDGYKQKKIERRGDSSWSLVDYDSDNGPFDVINISTTTIAPSAITGNITLTASKDLFSSDQIGALYRLESAGQEVTKSITAENTFTDPIRVTGIANARVFTVDRSGTFSATLTLQRSISAPGDWNDVTTYTTAGTSNYDDNLDNQIIYYRIGVKAGDYTSGTVDATLTYAGGTASGVVRITDYTSETSVGAEVLDALGSTDATSDWYEGLWSDKYGYPTSVALFEGRLWWGGQGYWVGSVSDGYTSYDLDVEGDSGPIIRQIGFGPVDNVTWFLPLQRLLGGTPSNVITARSSSFDEPLTLTNFNLKDPDTQGTATVNPVKIDNAGVYVNRGKRRIFTLEYNGSIFSYQSRDLMLLIPDQIDCEIIKLLVQRKPDTRIHAILSDGTVLMLVYDPLEEVQAWVTVDTDGDVEDGFVLPGEEEDRVYYVVERTSGRYIEKWALESECVGGTLNKQADSFVTGTGQTVDMSHLPNGTEVVAWGNGVYLGTFTVTAGEVDLGASYSYVVGLTYTATFKSSKLAYAAGMGTALTQKKKVSQLGLIMHKTHAQGIQYGTDLNQMDNLPLYEQEKEVDSDYIWDQYDFPAFGVNSSWGSDERLYLTASAPKPVTLNAAILTITTHDKS